MTTMKLEIPSPEPQVISLRAQKVPNHLFTDQSSPSEIPINLSGIPNYLPLTLNDTLEDYRVVIQAPRDLYGAQSDLPRRRQCSLKPQVTSLKSQVTSSKPQVTSFKPQVTSLKLQVAPSGLQYHFEHFNGHSEASSDWPEVPNGHLGTP